MNKKGYIIELITFIIIGIVIVAFFAALIYGFGLINTELTSGEMDTSSVNLTTAASNTFSYLNAGMDRLKLIAAVILFGYILATLIFAYASAKHPLWMFVYILTTILLVVFSIYISNSYETLQSNSVIGSTVSEFGIANNIVAYLPYWASVVGLIGIVLCVVGAVVGRRIAE